MNNFSKNQTTDNLLKLGNLFPEVLVECQNSQGEIEYRIDWEKLAILVGEISIPKDEFEYQFRFVERYLYDWPGKKMAIAEALSPTSKTLVPIPEESQNWETTKNLYLEGDNLDILKLLQTDHAESVRMIYIDPPYNTGKAFIYDDNYKDDISSYLKRSHSMSKNHNQSMGRYHANWLNMMYPRLKLAKNLLSENGVIFMSIDDNELSNLKRIADEIFGEDNFVGIVSVENNPKGRKNSRFLALSNDFCLIYAKNIKVGYFVENIPKSISEMKMDESGKFVHKSGKRVLVGQNDFNKEVTNQESEKHYSVYYHLPEDKLIFRKEDFPENADNQLLEQGYNRYISVRENIFIENTYTRTKLQSLFEDGALEFKENKIFEKNFNNKTRMKSLLTSRRYKAIVNNEETDYKMDVTTTSAGNALKELFNTAQPIFSSPKPVDLIKLFITLFDDKDFTVLDFFSGSSSTAQAVLEQNAEDGGTRSFIMVQVPEKVDKEDLAFKKGFRSISELGRERIRKVGEILQDKKIEDLDTGFKVFKLNQN